jgi:hypothetical protein
MNGDT